MTDQPPLIVHVIHHLLIGGMENGLVNLINGLPSEAFRHAIVCIEEDSDFRERLDRTDVEIIPLHRSKIGVMQLRRELYRIFKSCQPAIVHSRNMSGLDAILPACLAGVPARIHGEHGWDVNDLQGTHWKPALLRRLHAPLVSHYITVSEHLKTYLQQRVGIAAERVTPIINGVDTENFQPATSAPNLFPAGFLPGRALVLGTVGRLQPVKDQATLVRAFAALRASSPELRERLRLVIVGDGPLRAQLQELIDELQLTDCTWLTGARDDIPELLQAMDVFVLPSLAEGISNTILEAMASGLPILATAVGGNPELVRHGQTGALFAPGDVLALADLIKNYTNDPALLAQHADRARAVAVNEYRLQVMVTRYQQVYEQLLPPVRTDGRPGQ
ncbi:MAG: TIGR03088 family PEP-CTERM/XrtA system glycosyltransferase [Gammaproteobacteria bacterium]